MIGTRTSVTFCCSREERAWIDDTCRQFGLRKSGLLRLGLNEVAKALGVEPGVRLEAGQCPDQTSPQYGVVRAARAQIFDRRVAGEKLSALAREYHITPQTMANHMQAEATARGLRGVRTAIRDYTAVAAMRVLADPFTAITQRTREVAELLARGDTYESVAQQAGLTRQRVQQIATALHREAGYADLRYRRDTVPKGGDDA